MRGGPWAVVVVVTVVVVGAKQTNPEFTNLWVARIGGGEEAARQVAHDKGFTFKSKAGALDDYYVLSRSDLPPRSFSTDGQNYTDSLLASDQVYWAEQQKIVRVEERSRSSKPKPSNAGAAYRTFRKPEPQAEGEVRQAEEGQGDLALLGTFTTGPDPELRPATSRSRGLRPAWTSAYAALFDDPSWKDQWYLHDYRTSRSAVLDLNVVPVWRMGFTGRGVVVAAVDTGVLRTNPDIAANYVDELAYDYLGFLPAADPSPGLGMVTRHGTQVAGSIAMVANNSLCGVGIAYDARVTGIKSELDRDSTDLQRASALSHRNDVIDVYSCSWSNDNDGTQLVDLQPLTYLAVQKAVTKGRQGKGNVFVFSAGNHREFDTCASDSLSANPHVILVAAADQNGHVADYSERCAAVMVTAYSGGGYLFSDNVVAPEVEAECGARFSGTSAAAPAVSAVVALTLQANPSLTYRDVMHLLAMSAEVAPLSNSESWRRNGAGFWVSNDFGFGLLNARNMVEQAVNWTTVPRRLTCQAHSANERVNFLANNTLRVAINTDGCQSEANGVVFLEQVELKSTIYHDGGRGALSIALISPAGTTTTMIEPRYWDNNKWFDKWNILSVQTWGENPKGTWYVEVVDDGADWRTGREQEERYAQYFTLTMHGLGSQPAYSASLPRTTYTAFRLLDGTTSWNDNPPTDIPLSV